MKKKSFFLVCCKFISILTTLNRKGRSHLDFLPFGFILLYVAVELKSIKFLIFDFFCSNRLNLNFFDFTLTGHLNDTFILSNHVYLYYRKSTKCYVKMCLWQDFFCWRFLILKSEFRTLRNVWSSDINFGLFAPAMLA